MKKALIVMVVALAYGTICFAQDSKPAASQSATLPAGFPVTYAGKPRTKEWLNVQFQRFKSIITKVDGKYYDIGKQMALKSLLDPSEGEGEIGERFELRENWKVLTVIGPDEAVFNAHVPSRVLGPGTPSIPGSELRTSAVNATIHIKGFSTKALADDSDAPKSLEHLVKAGTYKYVGVDGGQHTVASFEVYSQISEDDFTQAIDSGMKLVIYRIEKVPGKMSKVTTIDVP